MTLPPPFLVMTGDYTRDLETLQKFIRTHGAGGLGIVNVFDALIEIVEGLHAKQAEIERRLWESEQRLLNDTSRPGHEHVENMRF